MLGLQLVLDIYKILYGRYTSRTCSVPHPVYLSKTKWEKLFNEDYRSELQELLSLLVERFSIPDPSLVYEELKDSEKTSKNSQREDWKRYRKEYCQPVQFRSVE